MWTYCQKRGCPLIPVRIWTAVWSKVTKQTSTLKNTFTGLLNIIVHESFHCNRFPCLIMTAAFSNMKLSFFTLYLLLSATTAYYCISYNCSYWAINNICLLVHAVGILWTVFWHIFNVSFVNSFIMVTCIKVGILRLFSVRPLWQRPLSKSYMCMLNTIFTLRTGPACDLQLFSLYTSDAMMFHNLKHYSKLYWGY